MALERVLVTGASSGIGQACALRLARLGYHVFAGVRGGEAAAALRAAGEDRIQPLILDVTSPVAIEAAAAAAGGEPLAGLINSAGIGGIGPLELSSTEDMRRMFEANVIGPMSLTRALLPALRQGAGRIINIGSIAGRGALPGTGAYDATKFALEALTDSLRMELAGSGVQVALIEPGAVATPIWAKTLADLDRLKLEAAPDRYRLYETLMAKSREEVERSARDAAPVAAVARAVEHALTARRPKTRYPIGWDARLALMLNLLPDRLRDWLILDVL
jgi:NAD(P)-dependent dehydrogenase (short-subunit alcohol dehydrogenase family)